MRTDYSLYINFIKSILDANDLTFFKSHPYYNTTLEHVTEYEGVQYLQLIKSKIKLSNFEIEEFCNRNDMIGNPKKAYIDTFYVSPSSLRYIFQAHLILSHMKALNIFTHDVIEIGGGYGGLCLAIFHFAEKYGITIKSYTIIDLENPSKLQQKYLALHDASLPVRFVDASTFGKTIDGSNHFVISNYCFSEIDAEFQKEYITYLFPKVSHGFMAWNGIPVYDFGFTLRVEEEYPKTGVFNKYVYF